MMSSPPLSTGERLKLSNHQRRRRQLLAIASGFALLILTIVAILFATGIFLIPTGSLSPSLANVSLYVARDGYDVTAVRASDGATLWRHESGGWYTAASEGLVYTSSTDDADVFALHASDGSLAWTAFAVGDVLAAGDGVVLVGRFDGEDPSRVQAINAADGSVRWVTQLDGINRPNVTLVGSTVYAYGAGGAGVSSTSDELFALRASDGAVLWKATTPASGSPAPAVGDGAVYVADNTGYVNAVRASDGTLLWRVKIGPQGSGTRSSLATAPGVVYAGSADGYVVALNDATGATLWRNQVNPSSAPTVAGGVVYVNTQDGALVALKATNGTQLWSLVVHGQLATYGEPQPTVIGGAVFEGVSGYCTFLCREAFVYGVQASNGAVAWRVATNAQLTATVAVSVAV